MAVDHAMNVGLITASVSRRAGGLFVSVRRLAQVLNELPSMNIQVLGLKDEFTDRDLPSWGSNLPMFLFDQRGPNAFGYASGMLNYLKQSSFDVIHTQGLWMYPSVVARQWSKNCCRPYVVTPRGMLDQWAVRNARWKKRFAGWLYENAHLRGAACLHALCESEAESIRGYGLRNPICIIPNGIDPPATTTVDPPSWQANLPDDAKVLFYLGRLHPKKGLSNLLRAWSMAHLGDASAAKWRLIIAGWDQGGHENELKSLAREAGIQDSVLFVGPQFEQAKHASYGRADAFILPSFSEGLPMVVLEAWAYGLPVLMTPQCNLSEGFQAQAALQIRVEPERIALGLTALFAMTDDERSNMGQQGRILVEERFNWSIIAEQMCLVYHWILGRGPMPDCVHKD